MALVLIATQASAAEIELWDWHLPRIEIYEKYAARFEEETGIKVVINHITDNYAERMTLALASGVLPDLVQFHPQYIAGFHDYMAPWPREMFEIYNWGDDMIGLEWWQDDQGLLRYVRMVISARLFFYNKDMWEQSGLPTNATEYSRTWTWEDMIQAARRLTRYAEDGSLAVAGVNFLPRLLFYDFYIQLGGRVYTEDGASTAFRQNYEKALTVTELINSLFHVHSVSRLGSSFTARTTAMQYDGPWAANTFAMTEDLDFGVMFNPTPSGRWEPYGYNAGDFSLAVFDGISPERKERAFRFLSWMLNNEEFWVDFALTHSAPPTLKRVWGDPRLVENAPLRIVIEAAPYTVPIADDPSVPRSAIDRLGEALAAGTMAPAAALDLAIQEFNTAMLSVPPVKPVEYTYVQPPLPPFQRQ